MTLSGAAMPVLAMDRAQATTIAAAGCPMKIKISPMTTIAAMQSLAAAAMLKTIKMPVGEMIEKTPSAKALRKTILISFGTTSIA